MIYRLCELMEKGYSYKDITTMLNQEFSLNLQGHSSPKGFKGAIVKKIEKLRQNSIDWQNYTDDEKLYFDTLRLFNSLYDKNRYGLLRDRHKQMSLDDAK